ncbi:MAG: acyl-CoA dehydrogenase family protein [Candidatus Nanopelagicales bacterium]
MNVEREFSSPDGSDLLALVRTLCEQELIPRANAAEERAEFPRSLLRTLGAAGLLALPYPKQFGGGGLPYHDYLQVVEELSSAWATVGLSVSVHSLSCFPLAAFGTTDQQERLLPGLLNGDLLGAYCLSETQAGSDAAALTTRAVADGDSYAVNGTKAWISHAGIADFYSTMVRTADTGTKGITCLLVPADSEGLSFATPERKLGFSASPTAQVRFDDVRVPNSRRIGEEGQGFAIAMAALEAGRLGIAACAVGIAQAALQLAVSYARERQQFGKPIAEFQGLSFLLADMATAVAAARALYLAAAKRKDAGKDFAVQASMAKLFATDAAMQVTTDAVQVLGGAGYVKDFPAERYFREAKALQIVEGTNQIQRMVIGRALTRS